MSSLDLVLYEEDHNRLQEAIQSLCEDSEAKAVFLIDRNGQQIAAAGDYTGIDTVSLATLTAGNVAATSGLAELLGEKGFTILFHEGERDNIHISIVGEKAIIAVLFDQRTTVGLVRLRVKKANPVIEMILSEAMSRAGKKGEMEKKAREELAEITDEDIDNLFK